MFPHLTREADLGLRRASAGLDSILQWFILSSACLLKMQKNVRCRMLELLRTKPQGPKDWECYALKDKLF